MKRSDTYSFILTLKLSTNANQEKVLNDRFFAAFNMKNKLIKYAKGRVSGLRQNKEYRQLLNERYILKEKNDFDRIEQIDKRLSELHIQYGLSENQFQKWMKEQQHKNCNKIDSLTAQKIASSVWQAVETCLFRKGKTIHFQKFENFLSLEGKNNSSGLRYRKGRIEWLGLIIYVQIRHGDDYAREALTHKIKYCRIIRKPMGTTWHWYVQLILEGIPPKKHDFLGKGIVGIDPGTSTEAVVSPDNCMLVELQSERKNIEDEIAHLQRKLDRSRRASNPQNYNSDGTVKKSHRKKWVNSKSYKKTRMRLKTLRRRNKDAARQSEEKLANTILCEFGSDIKTEKMNYSALAKKAKESHINEETGRNTSRKRFGKSIGFHAPARFLNILQRKLSYIDKRIFIVDTVKFRASQYNHVTDTYTKVELSDRWKEIDGITVQRDLYSAFLLMCAADETKPDRNMCEIFFPDFIKNHDTCIKAITNSDIVKPKSFGLA